MSAPKVPVCHRTHSDEGMDDVPHRSLLCIGSRCSLWAPVMRAVPCKEQDASPLPALVAVRGGCPVYETVTPGNEVMLGVADADPTGRGVCADNRDAVPWPDPAFDGGAS